MLGDSNTHNSRRLVYVCIGVVTLWALSFTAAIIAQCNPIKDVWTINHPEGSCVDIRAGLIAHAGLDITTDLFIYILPIPKILSSQLPKRQGYLLAGLFAVGGMSGSLSSGRPCYSLLTSA